MFGKDIILIENQNVEEEEDLEDRKLRENEIHNFLTHAMSEFDQSTVNSSAISNEGEDVPSPTSTLEVQGVLEKQYLETNADEQLKVLYEVRVREVLALNKELAKLKEECEGKEQVFKKKIVLLESENERKNISLKESQELVVQKNKQINSSEGLIENLRSKTKQLESNLSELNQDNAILREANIKLGQEVVLMEREFPLRNKVNDRELIESQRIRISGLEEKLARRKEQYELKEAQLKQIVCDLKQSLQDKDNHLRESNIAITKLTDNFNCAQKQCHELMRTIEELKSQKIVNHPESPLRDELRRIREQSERSDAIYEKVKRVLAVEYQGQIANITSENIELKDVLLKKDREYEDVKEQLQRLRSVQSDKDALQKQLKEVEGHFDSAHKDDAVQNGRFKELEEKLRDTNREFSKKIATCENERAYFKQKYQDLTSNMRKLQNENEVLYQKILDLECLKHSTDERSVQTSFSTGNSELIKLQGNISEELKEAHSTMNDLENKLISTLEENSRLKAKVDLEQERDTLIKQLQEKAAQFERIIQDKQKELVSPTMKSVGVNTDNTEGSGSVLKIKYDASIYKAEADLRKKIKQEFDEKLQRIINEFEGKSILQQCQNCKKLVEENIKLNEKNEQHRHLVIKIADKWLNKFHTFEKETESKIVGIEKCYNQHLSEYSVELEKKYADKYRVLVKNLKTADSDFRNKLLRGNTFINAGLDSIIKNFQQGTEEIAEIKKQYLRKKVALEKKHSEDTFLL